MDGLAVGRCAKSEVELDSGHCEGCCLFFRGKLNYDSVVLSIIVLAKLMGRRSKADEAVWIREECEFAILSVGDPVGVSIEQEELKISVYVDLSTGDETEEVN